MPSDLRDALATVDAALTERDAATCDQATATNAVARISARQRILGADHALIRAKYELRRSATVAGIRLVHESDETDDRFRL